MTWWCASSKETWAWTWKPYIGAVLGELTARDDLRAARRAGIGATVGLLLGTAAKMAIAFGMVGFFLFARFL